MLFNLDFVKKNYCVFLLLLIIAVIDFLISAVITQIFNPIAEFRIPTSKSRNCDTVIKRRY